MVNVRAGGTVTAELLESLTPQAPDTWTPVWTAEGTSPALGDASVEAVYTVYGRRCVGRLGVVFGSTTDFGASPTGGDNWRFSCPVTALSAAQAVGSGEVWPASGDSLSGRMPIRVRMLDTGSFSMEITGGRVDGATTSTGGLVDSITPFTWANGDRFYFDFQYWTAS